MGHEVVCLGFCDGKRMLIAALHKLASAYQNLLCAQSLCSFPVQRANEGPLDGKVGKTCGTLASLALFACTVTCGVAPAAAHAGCCKAVRTLF